MDTLIILKKCYNIPLLLTQVYVSGGLLIRTRIGLVKETVIALNKKVD